jgi:hypothetical protein
MNVFFTPEDPRMFPRGVSLHGRRLAVLDLCKARQFIEKRGHSTSGTTSHLMYGGLYGLGKLAVPQTATRDLAEAIVQDFSVGDYMALTENKPHGSPMRLYIDFDFALSSRAEASQRMWENVEGVMQEEVAKFFPEKDTGSSFFDCLILCSGLVANAADPIHPFKAGIHVVYQHIMVDVNMALYITAHIIHRLETCYLGSMDAGIWSKRVDQNVYAEGRGLRWAWQFKSKKCARCNGEGRKAACSSCEFGEAIDLDASMYSPLYMCRYAKDIVREAVDCDRAIPTVAMLMASSIRAVCVTEPSSGFVLYSGHLPLPVFKRKTAGTAALMISGDTAAGKKSEDLLDTSDPRFAAIAAAVRSVHARYADVGIQKIATRAVGFAVAVMGPGSCFCMNYGQDHRKQRVSFFVGKQGVTQSCYCKCPTMRESGKLCRDYQSEKFPLQARVMQVLFPLAVKRTLDAEDVFAGSSVLTPAQLTLIAESGVSELSKMDRIVQENTLKMLGQEKEKTAPSHTPDMRNAVFQKNMASRKRRKIKAEEV